MAIVAVKIITTIHPTTISIMRVMLTAPSVVGDVSEIVSGESLVLELLSGIFVVDLVLVDLVGPVVLSIESIPPAPARSGVTGLLSK